MKRIPISKPYFDEDDKDLIQKPLETGWVVQGPYVKEFEKKFAEFTGSRFAIAVTSCTTALHLSLIAAGIGPEDEVILPSFTFVATANAVEYVGAKPVFVDIDINTFVMDVTKIETYINSKTRAVIPVQLFGLSADMDPLMEIAEKYNLIVIEDAACGFGAYYKGKHVGTIGDFGCFSFHPRKAITTGEGGMIITQEESRDKLLRSLRDHGASKSDLERHKEKAGSLLPEYNVVGYNFRMTDFQGALGVSQMKKASEILRKRRDLANYYSKNLNLEWLKIPEIPKGYVHGFQSYVTLIKKEFFNNDIEKANEFRNKLMLKLEEVGISTRQGTHAVHTLGYYKKKYNLADLDLPATYEADRLTLSLPVYYELTHEDQDYVIDNIEKISKELL